MRYVKMIVGPLFPLLFMSGCALLKGGFEAGVGADPSASLPSGVEGMSDSQFMVFLAAYLSGRLLSFGAGKLGPILMGLIQPKK